MLHLQAGDNPRRRRRRDPAILPARL